MAQLTRELAVAAFREIFAQLDALRGAKNNTAEAFIAASDRLRAMIDRGALVIPAIPINVDLASMWRHEDQDLPADGGAPYFPFIRRLAHFHSVSKRILDIITDDVIWQVHSPSKQDVVPLNAPGSAQVDERQRPEPHGGVEPGVVIDGWTIESKLGGGAGGDVFKAKEKRDGGLERAIKICSPYATDDDDQLEPRFRSEADALAKLQHRAIVRYISAGVETGPPKLIFLIMELVVGQNLREVASTMPFEARVAVMAEILDGIHHAHQQGIYHRDIKPSNIMIRASDTQPVLVDFGLAYIAGAESDDDRTKLPPGTPGFIPNEVVNDPKQSRSPRHDIFQCGVTLYQIISGRLPRDQYVPLQSVDNALAGLDPIVMKAIAEPAERYASAAVFASELRAWLDARSRAQMMPPSTTAARLRSSLANKLTMEAERVRVAEEREEKLRRTLGPVATAVETAGISAFRELHEHIADLAPHLRFTEADRSTAPPAEDLRAGRLASPLCTFSYTNIDRVISFARVHRGTDLWKASNATFEELGRGRTLLPLAWIIYQTGSAQSPHHMLRGSIVVVEQDPMVPAFPVTLLAHRNAPHQPLLLTSPTQIREYVFEVLGAALRLDDDA